MANTMGTSSTGFKMSGLVSGLDTEALVKQMSMATKNKINKNQQKLDLLSWKQESYRTVIDKISKFKGKYLNILEPKSYLKSHSLFSAYKAKSTNDKISAIASSASGGKSYHITNIEKIASKASMESEGTIIAGTKLDFSKAEDGKEYTLQVTLDGLKKDITFAGGANAAENLQVSLRKAFGDDGFTVDSNSMKYDVNDGISHTFIVSTTNPQDTASLNAIGHNDEFSNKLNLNTKLKDANFANTLQGGSFEFSINGENFKFSRESTINEVIDKINKSNADVNISFDSLGQKFKIESKEYGKASSIEIKQDSGNLLTSMFGSKAVAGSSSMSSLPLIKSDFAGESFKSTDFEKFKNQSINITVNGVKKSIGLWTVDANGNINHYDDVTNEDTKQTTPGIKNVIKTLNAELEKEFGSDAPRFSYETDKDGNSTISLKGNYGDKISIAPTVTTGADGAEIIDQNSQDFIKAMGFEKINTNTFNGDVTLGTALGDKNFTSVTLDLDGQMVNLTADMKLSEVADKLKSHADVDLETGTITAKKAIKGQNPEDQAFLSKLFGTNYDDIANFSPASNTKTLKGENAVVTVNGVKITNNSNQIKIDGTTINLENVTPDMINKSLDVMISTERDTEDAFDAVVKFVADYNTMIDELHKEVNTRRPTDNGRLSGTKYEPLTEEQREEMTDKEIEKWEEKAKTGLLHNDKDIQEFLSNIRRAMSKVTTDKFSLRDMGITVANDYKQNGKLEIDEQKLKEAFAKNPEQIEELFTGENGLMNAVEKSIEDTIGTSATHKGSLVRIAGIKNTSTQTKNNISNQISTYSDMIQDLKDKYEREQQRYWKQFTNLEKVMNQYNTQASWLAEQFGGGMQ